MAVMWFGNKIVASSNLSRADYNTTVTNAQGAGKRQLSDITTFTAGAPPSPLVWEGGRHILFSSATDTITAGGITVANHNMTDGMRVLLRVSNTGWGGTDVYSGTTTIDNGSLGRNQTKNLYIDMGANYTAKYWDLRLHTYSPSVPFGTQGYTLTVGGLQLGYRLAVNCSMDFSVGSSSIGRMSAAASGETSTWHTTQKRMVNCKLYGLSDADFFGASSAVDDCLLSMEQAVGTTGQVTLLPEGDQGEASNTRRGIYGHIARSGPTTLRDIGSGGMITEKHLTIEEEV